MKEKYPSRSVFMLWSSIKSLCGPALAGHPKTTQYKPK